MLTVNNTFGLVVSEFPGLSGLTSLPSLMFSTCLPKAQLRVAEVKFLVKLHIRIGSGNILKIN